MKGWTNEGDNEVTDTLYASPMTNGCYPGVYMYCIVIVFFSASTVIVSHYNLTGTALNRDKTSITISSNSSNGKNILVCNPGEPKSIYVTKKPSHSQFSRLRFEWRPADSESYTRFRVVVDACSPSSRTETRSSKIQTCSCSGR